uniref:Creatininase family protein n=1 Tax=candidate division WOR-3 bacterium TaxID=2052148 RepID=A0A7C4GCM8_UNCW3
MEKTIRTHRLAGLTWQEFRSIVPEVTDAVLLPTGTVEAHGVTSLGTDNTIPEAIAARIAAPVNALIAPTIPYGITRSLLAWPGSTSVTPETFERYVYEVAASLAEAGFRRIVFLNGHGGNTGQLKDICFRLYREKKMFSLALDWWVLCAEETRTVYGHEGGHGGTDETAMVIAAAPEEVRADEFRPDLAFPAPPGTTISPYPGSIILYDSDDGLPDFDPARAQRLLDAVCARVAATVNEVFRRWQSIR